jgi:hypothetical protein
MYRVTRGSDATVVESESLLGAVFHALSCSVREASEFEIVEGATRLCRVERGHLYVASEELDVEDFVEHVRSAESVAR